MTRKAMRNICCVAPAPTINPPPLTLTPRQSLESAAIYGVIESAADIIERWNTETSTFARVTSMFYENKSEAMLFIERVKDLQNTMDLLVSDDPNSERLMRAHKLMQIAMKRLQKEFYQILSMNRAYLDPESVSTRSSLTSARSSYSDFPDDDDSNNGGDCIVEVEEVSTNVMADLKSIAESMIACGYSKDCLSLYKSIRKSIIDEGVYRLEVEKTSTAKVKKMSWEVMELKIRSWLKAVNVSMETLFKGEKILCDHVFESSNKLERLALVKSLETERFFCLDSRRLSLLKLARKILHRRKFSGCWICIVRSPETGKRLNPSSCLIRAPLSDLKLSSH